MDDAVEEGATLSIADVIDGELENEVGAAGVRIIYTAQKTGGPRP
jgi:hypothetical protein